VFRLALRLAFAASQVRLVAQTSEASLQTAAPAPPAKTESR
jgi:hypothetical protein